jgi:hypothetical protein
MYSSPGTGVPLAYILPSEIMLLAEEEAKKCLDEIKAAANKNEIHLEEFIVATRSVVSTILVTLKNKISICSGVIYLFEMRYIA